MPTTCIGADCDAQLNHVFPPGKYYFIAEVNSSEPDDVFVEIKATVNLNPAQGNNSTSPCAQQEVGGIRLVRTLDMTGKGDTLVKTYRYRLAAADGGGSSGHLFSKPRYFYSRPCNGLVVGASDLGKTNWLDAGYHIGYSRVEVESRGKQAGTTVYSYLNSSSYGANCRNLVVKQEEQDQAGNLVKRTSNTYNFVAINSSPGFQLTKEYDELERIGGNIAVNREFFWLANRSAASFWPQLLRTTEEVFGPSPAAAASKRDTTDYGYLAFSPGKTTQPVRVVKYLDRRQQVINVTRYCGQYSLNPTGTGPGIGLVGGIAQELGKLADRHLISIPVEHQTWLRTGRDSLLISGDLTHFRNLRPARVFAVATAKPLAGTDFISSSIGAQDYAFHQDPHYLERVSFPVYSPLGSLLQQRSANAPPTSYLWGYEETKPLAEAKNAAYNQVAYTSFEPAATGRWQYDSASAPGTRFSTSLHFTGSRAYKLDGNPAGAVGRTNLPAGEYELLVWAYGTGEPRLGGAYWSQHEPVGSPTPDGWQQHRFRMTLLANAFISLDAYPNQPALWIDEVRLHPVGARMVSYTYDPLVGMTSQTDPSGRTLTYEYDALGRLVRTRDEQGRLLSQQEYHYARP